LATSAPRLQIEPGVARWWTFAGGRINHTLKYGFEIKEGWKVVADNFLVRIEGDGIGHETVGAAIGRMIAHFAHGDHLFHSILIAQSAAS
jgi:ATP-dependent Lhr-like helicase